MAEKLLQHRFAKKLGCPIDELDDRGVIVSSAGIAAMNGGRAALEAVQAMENRGLDISDHVSQPLSERLARYADVILTMTRGHREAVIAQWPDVADRTFVLCPDGTDVADPIGGPAELYLSCAKQIDEALSAWVERIDLETLALEC